MLDSSMGYARTRGRAANLLMAVVMVAAVAVMGSVVVQQYRNAGTARAVGETYFPTLNASVTSAANTTVHTPQSGTRFVIKYLKVVMSAAGYVIVKDGTTTVLNVYCPANTEVTRDADFFGPGGLRSATQGNVLKVTNDTASAATVGIDARVTNE